MQLILCRQLALYGMKVLSQLFFVIIRSHNRSVQSGIPSI